MAKLAETKSDLLQLTQCFCQSALPDADQKRAILDGLFGTTYDSKPLLDHRELCNGLILKKHAHLTPGFDQLFFEHIEACVEKKAKSFAENLYYGLAPTTNTSDADIKKFEDFRAALEGKEKGESTGRLIKWVKDSIQDMREMQVARAASQKWLDAQTKL